MGSRRVWLVILVLAVGASQCGRNRAERDVITDRLHRLDAAAWRGVEGRRILFAHQSVGADILLGIEELRADAVPVLLTIHPFDDQGTESPPAFYETRLGRNGDPHGKIDDFARKLDLTAARGVDVAMMKLCYVDFGEATDVMALFSHYQSTVAMIRSQHPRLLIAHCTVPLEGSRGGLPGLAREVARKILRRQGTVLLNRRREAYNELMRDTYMGKEPFFDLALVESRGPAAREVVDRLEGQPVRRLAGAYTRDGGHLNSLGRRVVAVEFLEFLVGVCQGHDEGDDP